MRIRHWIAIGLATIVALSANDPAMAEWREFRGPTGQGLAEGAKLPVRWSEQENIAWKTPVAGRGWSSPIVLGNQIWITTATDGGLSLRAIAFDLATGKSIHNVEVFRRAEALPLNPTNTPASPTPVAEGNRVFVHFGTQGTACLAADTGKILWTNNELEIDHKEGPGSSPILVDNQLVVNCDGMDYQYVVALDPASGKILWKTPRSGVMDANPDFRKAYSTPLLVETPERRELVSPGASRVIAYEPKTGKQLWNVEYPGFSNVPRPVAGPGLTYVATGYTKPQLWAIRPGGNGDVTATHVAWKFSRQAPAKPSPILVGAELYIVSDSGVATCLDAITGKEHWTRRLEGQFSASPIAAGDLIYFLSESGSTTVIQAGTSFKSVAMNKLDGAIFASPAAAGSAIIIRTDKALYRIEEPKRNGTLLAN